MNVVYVKRNDDSGKKEGSRCTWFLEVEEVCLGIYIAALFSPFKISIHHQDLGSFPDPFHHVFVWSWINIWVG